MTDEIISEVHAIKDAIGAKYADDLDALFAELKRGEVELKSAGIAIIPPPAAPASMTSSAYQRNRFVHR